jgi:hypothetical protein
VLPGTAEEILTSRTLGVNNSISNSKFRIIEYYPTYDFVIFLHVFAVLKCLLYVY